MTKKEADWQWASRAWMGKAGCQEGGYGTGREADSIDDMNGTLGGVLAHVDRHIQRGAVGAVLSGGWVVMVAWVSPLAERAMKRRKQ